MNPQKVDKSVRFVEEEGGEPETNEIRRDDSLQTVIDMPLGEEGGGGTGQVVRTRSGILRRNPVDIEAGRQPGQRKTLWMWLKSQDRELYVGLAVAAVFVVGFVLYLVFI